LPRELWHTDEYLGVIDELTAAGLERFVGLLLSHARIELLVHGNFTPKEAKRFEKKLRMTFVDRDRKPLSPIIERTTKIPLFKSVTYQFKVEDVNSAIQMVYEAGPKRVRQSVALDMIQQIMEKPFYHQLRTVEQLGYLVWSGFNRLNNVDSFYFVIQSSSKDPVYLQGRIERFVSHFEKTLSAISSEEFETFKNALIAKREELPKTLNEETERYWGVILDQEYDFRFRDAEIKELRRLTLSNVLEVYRKVFTTPSTRRKLVVQAVGKHHMSVRPKGVLIRDLADFKRRASYFDNPLGKSINDS
jgi:insulysin